MPEDALTEEESMLKEIQAGLGVDLDDEGVKDIYESLSDEDKALLAGEGGESNEPADTPKAFSVTIGEKTYEAESQEALEAAVREGLSGEGTTGGSTPGLSAAARQQMTAGTGGTGEPTKDAPTEAEFDLKTFAEHFGDDPIKAYDYIDPYLPGRKKQIERLETLQADVTAREQDAFLDFADANPDFPLEDKDTIAFLEATTRGAKLRITKRNLKSAWDYMKKEKLAFPKAVAEEKPDTTKASEPGGKAKPAAPPRAKGQGSKPSGTGDVGGAGGSSEMAAKFAKLVDETDDMDMLRGKLEQLGLDMPGSIEKFSGGAATGEMN
jgi:hypothetical protein